MALIGIPIIILIFAKTTPLVFSVVFTYFSSIFFVIILLVTIRSHATDFKKLSSIKVSADSTFIVKPDGIVIQNPDGNCTLEFYDDSFFVPDYSMSFRRLDLIHASTTSSKIQTVLLGPIDELLDLYLYILEKYDSWLEKRAYFISPDEIAARYIQCQQEMSSIASKLRQQDESIVSVTTADAMARLNAHIDALNDTELSKVTLNEAKHDLQYPIEQYLDHVEPGEMIYFIHHFSKPRHQVGEIVLTTKGIIVLNEALLLGQFKSKIKYSEIESINLGAFVPETTVFKHVTIGIHKDVDGQDLARHEHDTGLEIMRTVERSSRMDAGTVPFDSPLFIILKKIGNVPIIV